MIGLFTGNTHNEMMTVNWKRMMAAAACFLLLRLMLPMAGCGMIDSERYCFYGRKFALAVQRAEVSLGVGLRSGRAGTGYGRT